ncbi:MAG: Flp pilus assembly complex ATPase component TadA, partial [Betaproteobacteria bacterium]|nr:Flp pilus assembly complex ATPase component TadA [Betaproteobacteria bacterium]
MNKLLGKQPAPSAPPKTTKPVGKRVPVKPATSAVTSAAPVVPIANQPASAPIPKEPPKQTVSQATSEDIPSKQTATIYQLEPEAPAFEVIQIVDDLPQFKAYLPIRTDVLASIRLEISALLDLDDDHFFLIVNPKHGGVNGSPLSPDAREVKLMLEQRNGGLKLKAVYHAVDSVLIQLMRETVPPAGGKAGAESMRNLERKSALFQLFASTVEYAAQIGATDIHYRYRHRAEKSEIRFRVLGKLVTPDTQRMPSSSLLDAMSVAYQRGSGGVSSSLSMKEPQQCQLNLTIKKRALTLRWASTPTVQGLKVVTRLLWRDMTTQTLKTLDQAGYLPDQVRMIEESLFTRGGMTIFAGVVGSGKTTTIFMCLKMLPKHMSKYTVEDPNEIEDDELDQIQISRSLTDQSDEDPFLPIKRQLKRLDPDVVLVGELRDQLTGAVARDIAESGHRAFATVHAQSCTGVISRLSDQEIDIPRSVLATPGVLNISVYQALVPTLCSCAHEGRDAIDIIEASEGAQRIRQISHDGTYLGHIARIYDLPDLSQIRARNSEGCPKCQRGFPELNGLGGRVVAAEVMVLTDEFRELIAQGDNLGLRKKWRSQRTALFHEPGTAGKTAREVALYRMIRGEIDPREVEGIFGH